jgi:hypothetical protein
MNNVTAAIRIETDLSWLHFSELSIYTELNLLLLNFAAVFLLNVSLVEKTMVALL